MKKILFSIIIVTISLVLPTQAIIGLGFHYNMALGSGLDASNSSKSYTATGFDLSAGINQSEGSTIQGFGLKLWLDFIPVVDIELATNFKFSEYDVSADLDDGGTIPIDVNVPLEIETGLPLKEKAKPVWGMIVSDLSIKYPVFKFPPAINIVKLYLGAGASHMASIAILDASTTEEVLDESIDPANPPTSEDQLVTNISESVTNKIKDEGYTSGMGGHVLVGVKVKPPVIPIALYTDGKYHFGGDLPDAVNPGFTLEMGAALAF